MFDMWDEISHFVTKCIHEDLQVSALNQRPGVSNVLYIALYKVQPRNSLCVIRKRNSAVFGSHFAFMMTLD